MADDWEVQQAKNRAHQARQAVVREAQEKTAALARARGYSERDTAILSIAVGKLVERS